MRGFLGSAAVVVGMGAGMACAQTPGITGVGIPPGSTGSRVLALSADGRVAVGNTLNSIHAFRWARSSGVMSVLPDGTSSAYFGNAVSADGQVVFGGAAQRLAGIFVYDTVRWRPPYSAPSSILDGGACGNGGVAAVSADGAIAAGSHISCGAGCSHQITFWTIPATGPGTSHCVNTAPGGHDPAAYGLSGDGAVMVGAIATGGADPTLDSAFVWRGPSTGGGEMQLLAALANPGGATNAMAVSRDGGYAGGTSRYHAARWRLSGGGSEPPEDLGLLPGWSWAIVNALSADGSVAAGSSNQVAFMWTARLGLVDLNQYLPATGIDLTGWHLDSATSLSDDGFTVGGYGTHLGAQEGFVIVRSRCGSADFDHDGDTATDADIEEFFACLGGNCCALCDSADFDGDGSSGTDADIEAFFRVLAGGTC